MAFCPNCGAQVTGTFCGACGKATGVAAPAAGGGPTPPSPGASPTPPPAAGGPGPSAAGLQDNVAGALCYVLGLLTGILFLVLEPYNRNPLVRFHAFQSIFLHVAVIGVWILLTVLGTALNILSILLAPVWLLLSLGTFVLWVMLLVKTFNGSKMVLPIIGPLAQKQAG